MIETYVVTFFAYTLSKYDASHDHKDRIKNVHCVDTAVPATSCNIIPQTPETTFHKTLSPTHQTNFVQV